MAEHDAAFATGTRRRFVSATALAPSEPTTPRRVDDPGLVKEGRDLELPPWNKGRYGTAIGRAVHAVLQTVDLATGAGIDELAAAQAAAEGVLGFEATIAALVQSALASPTVRAACREREYWRETYVAVPVEGLTLEGYVDLVYRDRPTDGALVVVDYKTDAIDDDAQLDERLDALPGAGRGVRDRGRGRDRGAGRPLRVPLPVAGSGPGGGGRRRRARRRDRDGPRAGSRRAGTTRPRSAPVVLADA